MLLWFNSTCSGKSQCLLGERREFASLSQGTFTITTWFSLEVPVYPVCMNTFLALRGQGLHFNGSSVPLLGQDLLGQDLVLEVLGQGSCGGHPLHTNPGAETTIYIWPKMSLQTKAFVNPTSCQVSFRFKIEADIYFILIFLTRSRVRNAASPVSVFQQSVIIDRVKKQPPIS